MPSQFEISRAALTKVAKLPKGKRRQLLKRIGELEWEKCARDVLYWIDPHRHDNIPYVYTKDPHTYYTCKVCNDGLGHNFNKLAKHLKIMHALDVEDEQLIRGYFEELDYVRAFYLEEYFIPIIKTWLREPLVLVEKSRDMRITWLSIALQTWDVLFHEGRQYIFQSQTAPKTLELVKDRAYTIWKQQPKFLRDVHKATFVMGSAKSGLMSVPTLDSHIIGLPQGAEQIRQYHPTGVYTDETAFQIEAGDGFAAIKPAIQAGGRYLGVSTPNPSWFMLAVKDMLDA